MRVLLDTHIVLALLGQKLQKSYPNLSNALSDPRAVVFVSVASIWEISIKTKIGKLNPEVALEEIAEYLDAFGLTILPINTAHAIKSAVPVPNTRDPFDRLLLAQCEVENLVLAMVDHALVGHPLAWNV